MEIALFVMCIWIAYAGWMISSSLSDIARAIREGNDKHK